jgi:hypothetical protein
MNNRKELLLDHVKSAGFPTDADRKELALLLENPALQRILFGLLTVSDDAVTALTNSDFTTDSGIKAAILLQAKARCYDAIVEDLIEFATTEVEPPLTKEN